MNPIAESADASLPQKVSVQKRGWPRRLFAFLGPAYLVSVGYMDPGNWATDIEGGARFGYQLLWVLVLSNAMAVLLQTLSARLGIVSGRDLAQACRESYPRPVAWSLWVLCEIAIAACEAWPARACNSAAVAPCWPAIVSAVCRKWWIVRSGRPAAMRAGR